MIEDIKELVHVISALPQMALWVAIGFWAYKIIIVGSIYGVIRLAITKAHDVYTRPKTEEIGITIDDVIYYSNKYRLIAELRRIVPKDKYSDGSAALDWLSDAITAKIEKDGLPKK